MNTFIILIILIVLASFIGKLYFTYAEQITEFIGDIAVGFLILIILGIIFLLSILINYLFTHTSIGIAITIIIIILLSILIFIGFVIDIF